MESDYIPVLIQILAAIFMGGAIVLASHIFGQRAKANKLKNSAYECGISPEGQPHPRFGARYYLAAMLFVIFDIEIVFMIPLAMSYSDLASDGLPMLLPVLFFIAVIAIGMLYELKKGALNWNIPKTN